MANTHFIFQEYNRAIRLSDEKRSELILVRDNLRSRLQTGYSIVSAKLDHRHAIESQSQGSFVMDTIIKPERDDYDLDDGIYFIGALKDEERPKPSEFHVWVIRALDRGHDDIEEIVDKSTCVRVLYKKGFHIDLPIYYAEHMELPDLADKSKGWILSMPVEFIAWFEAKIESGFQKAFLLESRLFPEYEKWTSDIRKTDHQLRRLVRYLKAWCDLRKNEMPCGIILTILAANNYYPHERDDVSLKETLINIQSELSKEFKCERPTTPKGEDLLASYERKEYFMQALSSFIADAKKGVEEPNARKAAEYWQRSLGSRYPADKAPSDVQVKPATSALAAGASTSRPWSHS